MISADPFIKVIVQGKVVMTAPLAQIVDLYSLSIKQIIAIQMAIAQEKPLPSFTCNDQTVELELCK